jgi:pyruvate dehydrogenase E1 component alpha subunit
VSVTEAGADQPRSIMAPDGSLPADFGSPLTGEELLSAYRLMKLTRVYDTRAFNLQRQGRLGTFSQVTGQEASVVGSALALDPARDWVVPQYRELPAMLHMGYTLTRALLYFRGNPAGNAIPEGVNLMPFQISLGAQVPHAVGIAWGLSHQGRDGVVMTYFGDGTSSEGDIHEAMNLAGVRRAPVVFVLQNNGWAISTPVSSQTAAPNFALRAAGYGFPGELVDGNDFFAVHDACARAVARARRGEGPTLIESRAYRLGAHNTADDPTRYVDAADEAERWTVEPLARMRRHLVARGLLDDEADSRLEAELADEMERAVAEAEAYPAPHVGQIFDHVYATEPPRVARQRREATGGPADA